MGDDLIHLRELPGGDFVEAGLRDLGRGVVTVPALLVSMAATRLRRLGLEVPEPVIDDAAHRLYEEMAARHGNGAHAKYNAWRRRLASFLRMAACADRSTQRASAPSWTPSAAG